MLTREEAIREVEDAVDCTVEACVPYRGGFLARAKLNSAEEAHYDPFFMVNANTGAVAEFSVMVDGDLAEINTAFEEEA